MTMIKTMLDPDNPPVLSEEEKAAYDALDDKDIDYSDAPEMSEDMFARAWRGNMSVPEKEKISVRLDADILSWLRGYGRGYQTRMNRILRAAMLHQQAEQGNEPNPQ